MRSFWNHREVRDEAVQEIDGRRRSDGLQQDELDWENGGSIPLLRK
jgi:hypothetical protein